MILHDSELSTHQRVLRVERGARFLDGLAFNGNIPTDWHRKIDIHLLDLGSLELCILGQLFAKADFESACGCCDGSGYEYALSTFDIDTVECGFSGRGSLSDLTAKWRLFIAFKGDMWYSDVDGYTIDGVPWYDWISAMFLE